MAYEDLIKQLGDSNTADEASRRLAQTGAPVIGSIVDAIRKVAAPPRVLADVLLQLRGADVADEFVKLILDDDTMVQLTSIEALGHLGDARVVKPLEQMLEDDEQLPTPKELAATALGNLRSSESIPVLAAQMNKAAKAKEHSLAIACAEALAKLGDQQGFPVIVKCSQLKSKPEVRTLAAQALCYVNSAGMFSLMQEAIKDKYYEVRRAAVEAV
jgi:HEAT repeat protein